MTLMELEQVFKNVYKCLNKGGIFIFDMNMKYHLETEMKKGLDNIRERPKYLFIRRTEYDAEKKLGKYRFTIFRPENKLWKRSDIILYQTLYPMEDIVSSLEKTGFNSIKTYSFNQQRELQEANENSSRVFFYSQKR